MIRSTNYQPIIAVLQLCWNNDPQPQQFNRAEVYFSGGMSIIGQQGFLLVVAHWGSWLMEQPSHFLLVPVPERRSTHCQRFILPLLTIQWSNLVRTWRVEIFGYFQMNSMDTFPYPLSSNLINCEINLSVFLKNINGIIYRRDL